MLNRLVTCTLALNTCLTPSTGTVCWPNEAEIHLTASRSPGCRLSADPLQNLHTDHNTKNTGWKKTSLMSEYAFGEDMVLRLTGFAGWKRPNCLRANLPNRPGPLQLLGVCARRGFGWSGHSFTTFKKRVDAFFSKFELWKRTFGEGFCAQNLTQCSCK